GRAPQAQTHHHAQALVDFRFWILDCRVMAESRIQNQASTMKLSPVLKLVRLSALPSAWADQFGGMALALALAPVLGYRFDALKIAWLLPASLGVYLGGMALND